MKEISCRNQKGEKEYWQGYCPSPFFSHPVIFHFPQTEIARSDHLGEYGQPTGALPGIITALITVELERMDMARMGDLYQAFAPSAGLSSAET